MDLPPILVLTTAKATDRLDRLEKRLSDRGLSVTKTFNGLPPDDPVVVEYIDGLDLTKQEKLYAAIVLSHLEAYTWMIDHNYPSAIVLEDDACLHKDFKETFPLMLDQKPSFAPIMLFSTLLSGKSDIREKNKLCTVSDWTLFELGHCWSSCAYWIDLTYARYICQRYSGKLTDHAAAQIQKRISPEDWICDSHGVFVYPPLAIEECLDSNVQTDANLVHKRNYWLTFGVEKYM